MTTNSDFKLGTSFFDDPYLRILIQNFGRKGYTHYDPRKIPPKKGIRRIIERVSVFIQKMIHYLHGFFSSNYKSHFSYVAKVINEQKNAPKKVEPQKGDLQREFEEATKLKILHIKIKALDIVKRAEIAKLIGIPVGDLDISDDYLKKEKKKLEELAQIIGDTQSVRKDSVSSLSEIDKFRRDAEKAHPVLKEMFDFLLKDGAVNSWNGEAGILRLSKIVRIWVPSTEVGGTVFLLGPKLVLNFSDSYVEITEGYSNLSQWQGTCFTSKMFSFKVKGNSVDFCAGKGFAYLTRTQMVTDLREKWGKAEVLKDGEDPESFIRKKM